jgi:DNA-binding XRE family transcriptional regulator
MAKKPALKLVEPAKKSRVTWNDKVAKSRNKKDWKRRIMEGKSEVPMHPTVLRQKRIQKGFSQSDMAAKAELTTTTYGDVERGKRPVKKTIAETISGLIGSSTQSLFEAHHSESGKALKDKLLAKKAA